MTVRITVVIIQARQPTSAMNQLEEALITRVMLTNGLDAVVVGPLEQMQPDDTDALCLSQLPPSSEVVCWLPQPIAQQHLLRLGVPGWRAEPGADSNNMPNSYYRQLSLGLDINSIIQVWEERLKSASLSTVQIALPTKSVSPSKSSIISKSVSTIATTIQSPSEIDRKNPPLSQRTSSFPKIDRQDRNLPATDSTEFPDELDQLVDELEMFDR